MGRSATSMGVGDAVFNNRRESTWQQRTILMESKWGMKWLVRRFWKIMGYASMLGGGMFLSLLMLPQNEKIFYALYLPFPAEPLLPWYRLTGFCVCLARGFGHAHILGLCWSQTLWSNVKNVTPPMTHLRLEQHCRQKQTYIDQLTLTIISAIIFSYEPVKRMQNNVCVYRCTRVYIYLPMKM